MITSRQTRDAVYAEEKAEVEVLQAQVRGYSESGKKLGGLLGRLQGGGRSVQDSIGPIQDNTRRHQTVSNSMRNPHPTSMTTV